MNKKGIEYFREGKELESIPFFVKSVDMLMYKSIHKHIRPIQKLGEMKVLTFNNLACVY